MYRYLYIFYRRHSGMDCRNPEHRDLKKAQSTPKTVATPRPDIAIHGFWISAIHAEMTCSLDTYDPDSAEANYLREYDKRF
jgi:hypothetical protein